jgi:DNA-directed RNA polymerase specialized sigma24 family protein
MIDVAELSEVRTVLRFAAGKLSDLERSALSGYLTEATQEAIAERCHVSRSAIGQAQERALVKMRKRLALLGIRGSRALLSREVETGCWAGPDRRPARKGAS